MKNTQWELPVPLVVRKPAVPLVAKEMSVMPVPLGTRCLAAWVETGAWILSVDLPGIPVCQHSFKWSYIEETKWAISRDFAGPKHSV